MKNFNIFLTIFVLLVLPCIFCGCNNMDTNSLAIELDASYNNFSESVENLDVPTSNQIDNFENIDSNTENINTEIDTSELFVWLENFHKKINILNSIKSDIRPHINKMKTKKQPISDDDISSIRIYMNIIKDNSNFMTFNNGIVIEQLDAANSLLEDDNNANIANAYIIKAVETLQLRCAKIDSSILSFESIIDILEHKKIEPKQNEEIASEKTEEETEKSPEPTKEETNENIEKSDDEKTDEQEIENKKIEDEIEKPQESIEIAKDNVKETNAEDLNDKQTEAEEKEDKSISREIYKESEI